MTDDEKKNRAAVAAVFTLPPSPYATAHQEAILEGVRRTGQLPIVTHFTMTFKQCTNFVLEDEQEGRRRPETNVA